MSSPQKPSSSDHASLVDIIMNIPFFEMLDAAELKIVANHMNYFEIDAGETLFSEGDTGNYVCFVVTGALDVFKEAAVPEKSVVIATVTKHRSIGEMSVIDDSPRSATVKARTKTTAVALSKKGFDRILDSHPKIGIRILKKIARLVSLNLRKTSSRLADYMLPIT